MTQAVSSSAPATSGMIFQDAEINAMSPEQIIEFVRKQLGSIDDQFKDYQKLVQDRARKAAELREAQSILKELRSGNKDFKDLSPEDMAQYNRAMTLLAKNTDLPCAKAAYNELLESFSGFTATSDLDIDGVQYKEGDTIGVTDPPNQYVLDAKGNIVQNPDGSPMINKDWKPGLPDRKMNEQEIESVLANIKDAQEGINSDNQMLLMDLQRLLALRNEILTKGSNELKGDHDTKSAIINNYR